MTSISIRHFEAGDAEACAAIFGRAWHGGHAYAPRHIDTGTFRSETEGERILVAEADGEIVGFVSIFEPQRFVHHLYIEPSWQRRAVGAALLDEALRSLGGAATLKCQTGNPGALAFYRRLGWTPGETGESDIGPWVRLHSPARAAAVEKAAR
jgi:GNAT superfamily N-acetyltransferase